MKKFFLFLILITLLGLWPFFKKGYFESHDGEWMVIRFTAFHQTLRGGQFPVRFVDRLNNNYGYPVMNFLYPLPFYLAELPKVIGFNFVDSIKIVFVFSALVSTLAMFWALSQLFDKLSSFTGSVLYFFVPYRFVDLYVRGSLGENLAFAFVPLIFGSVLKVKNGEKIFLPLLAIFVAGLISSHNVIAAIFIPSLLIFTFLKSRRNFEKILGTFFLGFLIYAFFWIPAIFDLRFVRLSQFKVSEISDHLVNLNDILFPSWGFGPAPSAVSGLSTQLGTVSILIILSYMFKRFFDRKKSKLADFMATSIVITIFFMIKPSQFFWKTVPFMDIIQFPWRLLSLTVFASAFLASFLVNSSQKKILLSSLIIVTAVTSTIAYTKPLNFIDRGDGFYSTNEDTTTVRDEYLPLWVKEKPQNRAYQKLEVVNGQAEISQNIRSSNYRAQIKSKEDSQIKVNTIYFPGWQILANGKKLNIDYQNNFGLMNFKLPKGEYNVIISYKRTPVHLISEAVSFASIILTGFLILKWRKQNS
jgi:hypothetical protein